MKNVIKLLEKNKNTIIEEISFCQEQAKNLSIRYPETSKKYTLMKNKKKKFVLEIDTAIKILNSDVK